MSRRKINVEELLELSKTFHEMSIILGNYRLANWHDLTRGQRANLESKQWTLFNTASDLNAMSVVKRIKLLEAELEVLKQTTEAMKRSAEKINNIKHAIEIAGKAVAFAGAIYVAGSTGNIPVLLETAKELIDEIQGEVNG